MKKRIPSDIATKAHAPPVKISATVMDRLIDVLKEVEASNDPAPSTPPPALSREDRHVFARGLARQERIARRVRAQHFPPAVFGEPAWEILLLLYASQEEEGAPLALTQVSELIGTPLTTTVRWVDYLESSKLVERRRDKRDRRTTFVELTELAEERMMAFFCRPKLCTE